MLSKLALEKSSFRRTDVDTEDALAAGLEGEDPGPRDGCLRAGDCRNVLIGDFDRGGNRILACLRSLRIAFGSGMVPIRS